ncbi:MAG TPA: pitrilysin family protein [Spirochaetia bacterium]|nr:pitrilysin family protein [Spirochaetia bacterium]
MIHTEKLASGATLLLEPVDRTDTLCIGFWFLHGSRDESPAERGYSHFLEHMLFKGTSRRSALAIAQEIDRVGGLINAFTEKEATCVYVILPKEHLRLAFDVLSDMTVDSVLDPAEMEKEKAVIVNEIRSVDDSPEEKGHDRFLVETLGDHPLSRKITGEVEEVQSIDRPSLERFYRQRLVGANTVIAVAGNCDPSEVRDLAERVFPSASPASLPKRSLPAWTRRVSVVPDRFNQAQIYAGTAYPLDHDIGHYYTSLVFSTAFGESMSCRLFQRLREELALCYTVYSFRSFFSDTGMWTIYANATPAQTRTFLGALDAELCRLLAEPLSEKEISDAKSHLGGSMILSREDMETRMKRLARQFTMMERILTFEESVAALQRVTTEEAAAFARRCLGPDTFSLLTYGCRGISNVRGFDFSFQAAGVAPSARRRGPG